MNLPHSSMRRDFVLSAEVRLWISIAGPILAILVLVAGCSFALLSDVARAQNEAFAQISSQLVERSLKAKITELDKLADDNAEWDKGYQYASVNWNKAAIAGSYYSDFSEVVSVVEQNGDVKYLSTSQKNGTDDKKIATLIAGNKLSDAVRHRVTTIGNVPQSSHLLLNHEDGLWIVTTSIIRPMRTSSLKVQPSHKRYFYTLASFVSPDWLKNIGSLTGVENLAYTPGVTAPALTTPHINLAVGNMQGAVVGWLTWTHEMPGTAALVSRKIVIGLGLAIIGLISIGVSASLINGQMKTQRKALALAEDASRMKSEFLANMSHELRTPLNAVIGYAEIVAEDSVANGAVETAKDAGKITRAAHHLLSLINAVLDHAKLEAGKIEIDPEIVVLTDLFGEVVEVIEKTAQDNGNTIILTCDPEIGNAQTDRLRLKQCLLNLVSNSVKFTRDGKITIAARPVTLSDIPCIRVAITDTGIGMSEEVLARLFRPFEQANSSTTRTFGGTGLGLSITKQLIEAMGGTITVSSQEGLGSVFTLILPRGDVADATHSPEQRQLDAYQFVDAA
jgi:signal transduction histidine kinase